MHRHIFPKGNFKTNISKNANILIFQRPATREKALSTRRRADPKQNIRLGNKARACKGTL